MLIYKITHRTNSKVYIGQTINSLKDRWTQHCCCKQNTPFHNAIRKYGKDDFELSTLIENVQSIEELNLLEESLIKSHSSMWPNGYNLKEGGHNKRYSELSKAKISAGNKGKVRSEESKLKQSIALSGRKKSLEHKKKIGLGNSGKKRSDSSREKQSLNHSDVSSTKNPRWNGYCHTPFGVFNTTVEAEKTLQIPRTTILYRCKHNKDNVWFFSKTKN